MADLTSDPNDPRLHRGVDTEETGQHEAYLVLSEEERAKGFVMPVRTSYRHDSCRGITTMSRALAETYARDPGFYGATYCVHCQKHLEVSEFEWLEDDGTRTGIAVGDGPDPPDGPIIVRIDYDAYAEALERLKAAAEAYPGVYRIQLAIGERRLKLGSQWYVDGSAACLAALMKAVDQDG